MRLFTIAKTTQSVSSRIGLKNCTTYLTKQMQTKAIPYLLTCISHVPITCTYWPIVLLTLVVIGSRNRCKTQL